MSSSNVKGTIIIGAGAAGLMCAQFSAASGQTTLILDHSAKLAEKIRISGGGRCNFTNIHTAPHCYLSHNPNFVTSALSRYTPQHFTELLDEHKISYHEKILGQLFCDGKSQIIIDLLDYLCRKNDVVRLMETCIREIEKTSRGFSLETSRGVFHCEKLVIATGGLSIPLIGATGFAYDVAKQFGLKVIPTMPALVPLTLAPHESIDCSHLAGTSFFSKTTSGKISFEENTLFTHRGLSGPAILQISSYWHPGESIEINFLPTHNIANEIATHRSSKQVLSNFLSRFFSKRLAEALCHLLKFDKSLSQLSNIDIKSLSQLIHHWSVCPSGSEGYKKAEVTRGGVDTADLNSKTMGAKNVEGLYFIGECIDVTGWLGGYNFQWAWASAYAAACHYTKNH